MLELNKIYCMDCLRGLKQLDDNSIDLTVTSPPYNAGIDYGRSYNDNKPLHEYLSFIKDVLKEIYRVTKVGGRVAINIANTGRKPYIPLSSYLNIMAIELGFLCRGEVIWDKGASVGASCAWGSWCSPKNPSLRDVHEYIEVYSKGDYSHSAGGWVTINSDEFIESTKSIWRMQTASAKKMRHPAPYPEMLPRRIISLYSYENDIVLDPFMGSGTTAKVARALGRKYIGFEISQEYVDLANNRLQETKTLFD